MPDLAGRRDHPRFDLDRRGALARASTTAGQRFTAPDGAKPLDGFNQIRNQVRRAFV